PPQRSRPATMAPPATVPAAGHYKDAHIVQGRQQALHQVAHQISAIRTSPDNNPPDGVHSNLTAAMVAHEEKKNHLSDPWQILKGSSSLHRAARGRHRIPVEQLHHPIGHGKINHRNITRSTSSINCNLGSKVTRSI
ncbi:hypothetical protein ACLOJK_027169, partial [Asimina triloba]